MAFLADSGGSLVRLTHRVVGRVPLWPVGVASSPLCLPGALTGSTQPTHTVARLPRNPQLLSVPSVLYGSLWTRKHPLHHLYECYRSHLVDEQTEAPREMGPHRQDNGKAGTTTGFSSFHCWGQRRTMVLGNICSGSSLSTLSLHCNPFSTLHCLCELNAVDACSPPTSEIRRTPP